MAPSNRYLRRMREYHALAEAHFQGQCLLAEIDMHSNIDLREGLRGAQNLDRSCLHLDGPDALTHLDDILALLDWLSRNT